MASKFESGGRSASKTGTPSEVPQFVSADERGVVLIVMLILFLGFGGIAYGSLTMVVVENQKNLKHFNALQAQAIAEGELEIAKNIVNASAYTGDMRNQVIADALDTADQSIPGTNVRIERVGATNYFRLQTTAIHAGVRKQAEAVVRSASPVSMWNLFVIDHPVGVSGRPRGAIHTNKSLDFYFPSGNYRDAVTAGEGFRYLAGANTENTDFGSVANPSAPTFDMLADVDFESLWSRADTLAVTEGDLVAEIEFRGDTAKVDLFRPAHTVMQTRARDVTRIARYEPQTVTENVPIYADVPYTVMEMQYEEQSYVVTETRPIYSRRTVTREYTENVYEYRDVPYTREVPVWATRMIEREIEETVWVEYGSDGGASSSGGTVAIGGSGAGYWQTRTVTRLVPESYISHYVTESGIRRERVKIGTRIVTREVSETYVSGYEDVEITRTRMVEIGEREVTRYNRVLQGYEVREVTRDVPVYETVTETYEVPVAVAEQFIRTETMNASGIAYIAGSVRKMSGRLDGRLSLIVGGACRITGSVQYVDSEDRTRMLNGLDPNAPYLENPAYSGESLLAVMAHGDIHYANDCPDEIEINASLVSATGTVGFEGIEISADGTDVWTDLPADGRYVRESMRRLGGIVSGKRPVATYVNSHGHIVAGFKRGESMMDSNLILSSGNNQTPPFMFDAPVPVWVMHTSGRRLSSN
jgi:hypothetical protein